MTAASLDTNILVRALIGDEPQKSLMARKLLQQDVTFHVSDLAISEFSFVSKTQYYLTDAEVAERIEFLMELPNINCNRQLYKNALPVFLKNPKLSLVDCCLIIQAQLNDAVPLYTFDKKLANQSGGLAKYLG